MKLDKESEKQTKFEIAPKLVQRLQQKDEKALAELIQQQTPFMYYWAFKCIKNVADAEEVVNHCFLDIWDKIDTFTPEKGTFKTWIITIIRNASIDQLRKNLRRWDAMVRSSIETNHEGRSEVVLQQDELDDRHVRLVELLQHRTINNDERAVLKLFWFEGFSQGDIAKEVGKPLGTVKARLRRGFKKLQKLFLRK